VYTTDEDILALQGALIECRTWFGV